MINFLKRLLLLLVLSPGLCYAQHFEFKEYSLTEGTSVPEVSDVAIDWNGNLWVATKGDGLFRFNGSEFKQYTRNDNLPGDYILSLLVDKEGYLWIATLSGVVRFDGKNFRNFTEEDGLPDNRIRTLYQNNGGDIWVGTDQNGLYRLSGESFQLVDHTQLNDHLITSITQLSDGDMAVGTDQGALYGINPNGSLDTLDLPIADRINCIYESKSGQLWVGTESSLLVSTTDEIWRMDEEFPALYKVSIQQIIDDQDGNLWIATSNGLYKYFENDLKYFGKNQGLTNSAIQGLVEDESGNLWIAAGQNGLFLFSGERFAYLNEDEGLPYNLVSGIEKDNQDRFWIATMGGGVMVKGENQEEYYSLENSLPFNLITSTYKDQSGNIWLGSKGDGIAIYLAKRGRFTFLKSRLGQVNRIQSAANGEIWVSHDQGINVYRNRRLIRTYTSDQFDSKSITSLGFEPDRVLVGTEEGLYVINDDSITLAGDERLKKYPVSHIQVDGSGNHWICTLGGGLFSSMDGKFRNYTKNEGLSSNLLYHLVFDINGAGWLNTSTGMERILINEEGRMNNVIQYGEVEGYRGISRYSSAVYIDDDSRIWFGTNRGVNIYDALEDNIDVIQPSLYIKQMKLSFEEVDWSSYSDSVDSWFNIPYNLTLPHDRNHLSFLFEGVSLSSANEILYSYRLEPIEKSWSPPGREKEAIYPNLAPGKYTFRVKVTDTRGIWNEKEIQYAFSIEKPYWLHPLFYIGLSVVLIVALYFVFKLYVDKITRANKELEEKIAVRTAELYTQKEELKKQKEELEKTNKKLSRAHEIINDQNVKLKTYNFDLENQVIERTKRLAKTNKELHNINKELDTFIYKASHDLLGPLARLKGICNVAAMEVEDKTSRKYFNMLNDSAQRTYEILKTLIQLISIRESKIEPEEVDLELMMKQVVTDLEETEGFSEVEIQCEYTGIKKAHVDEELLKIIMGNLMQNSIEYRDISKHTPSFVKVNFSNGEEQLKIEVIDNGIGIDKESSEKIFEMFYRGSLISKGSGLGLYISRVIVRKFGGSIEYSVNEAGDTAFSVKIPQTVTSLPVS